MQGRNPLLVAVVFMCAGTACLAQQKSPKTDLSDGSITLAGPWQFHLGDDMKWAQPETRDSTGTEGWEQIDPGQTWGAQGHWAYVGYAWYRKHIHYVPAPGASPDVALLMPDVCDAYEIYWNGRLVGHLGAFPPDPAYRPPVSAHTFGLGPVRDGVLALRVWKTPMASGDPGNIGGLHFAPQIGSPRSIAALKAQRDYMSMRGTQYTFGLELLYGLVMLLSLVGWLRNRSQRALFWMAALSGANLLDFLLAILYPSLNFLIVWGVPVSALLNVGLWFLLLYVLKLDDRPRLARVTRWLAIIGLIAISLDGMLLVFDWNDPALTHVNQVADAVLTLIFSVTELYPLVLVAFALHGKLDSARWLVAIAAFLNQMPWVIGGILEQGSRYTHWSFGQTIVATPLFTIAGNDFVLSTITSTLLFLALIYAVCRSTLEAAHRQNTLEQEIKSAREVQHVLIPEALPEISGYAMTSVYRSAQEVGGDFFQVLSLDGEDAGSTLILLGDVSGKGLKAAMTVSLIVGTIRTLAETTNTSPGEVLSGLNRRLHGRLQHGFATCLALRLNNCAGDCVLASAGHPAPYLNGKEVALPGELPLGLNALTSYEEKSLKLRVGDHLALYTDGLLEARSASGEIFSFDRLNELFATNPDAAKATEAAVDFGQDDDITVLTLTRLAVGEQSTTQLTAPLL